MGWKITLPSTIYAIRCIENGKVYIGRTQDLERRMREHLTDLKKGNKRMDYGRGYEPSDFQTDFNKYGEASFEVYLLEEEVAPGVVNERETFWIQVYNSTDRRYGYNKLDGVKTTGFSNFKEGLPPVKSCRTDPLPEEQFGKLNDVHKQLVVSAIYHLLRKQEEQA